MKLKKWPAMSEMVISENMKCVLMLIAGLRRPGCSLHAELSCCSKVLQNVKELGMDQGIFQQQLIGGESLAELNFQQERDYSEA
jgi:hypothetical protein